MGAHHEKRLRRIFFDVLVRGREDDVNHHHGVLWRGNPIVLHARARTNLKSISRRVSTRAIRN